MSEKKEMLQILNSSQALNLEIKTFSCDFTFIPIIEQIIDCDGNNSIGVKVILHSDFDSELHLINIPLSRARIGEQCMLVDLNSEETKNFKLIGIYSGKECVAIMHIYKTYADIAFDVINFPEILYTF